MNRWLQVSLSCSFFLSRAWQLQVLRPSFAQASNCIPSLPSRSTAVSCSSRSCKRQPSAHSLSHSYSYTLATLSSSLHVNGNGSGNGYPLILSPLSLLPIGEAEQRALSQWTNVSSVSVTRSFLAQYIPNCICHSSSFHFPFAMFNIYHANFTPSPCSQ